jgi:MFS superfamily sulfate permease-like transporter
LLIARAPARSAQKEVAAGVSAGAIALMANPLVAQAAVTPSLQNFLYSLVAGGVVLAAIAGAVTLVSNFDPVSRD